MSRSLTDRIRNYVCTGMIVGGLSLGALTGCESTNSNSKITPAMSLSVIARANAMKTNDPKKAQAWATTSDFADKYGDRENQLDAANAGRNNNNGNNGNQNNNNGNNGEKTENKIKLDEDFLFVCSDWVDDNKDECAQLNEFRDFQAEELYGVYPTFVLYNNSKRGEIKFLLKGEDGKVVRECINKDVPKGGILCRGPPKEGYPYGKYTGEWYRDEVLLGKKRVSFHPAKEPKK
jgi:hypothetical protein